MVQKEASYYLKLPRDYVECYLCPHNCRIMPARLGLCGVRRNYEGRLCLTAYGKLCLVEEKPAIALPLSPAYEKQRFIFVGSLGCNMKCPFCLTWRSSQLSMPTKFFAPEELAEKAVAEKFAGIAFTYNEPTMAMEYVLEVATIARGKNLLIAVATNGFLNQQPWMDLLGNIDLLVVDIKSWDSEFWRLECGASKEIVLKNIQTALNKVHLEVSFPVIEGRNDQDEGVNELGKWLASLSPDIPLHLIRFQPAFCYSDVKETRTVRLYQLQTLLRHDLKNVYVIE